MTGRAILTPKLNTLNAKVAATVGRRHDALHLNTYRAQFQPSGKTYRPNGKRECARRRWQIARRMLRMTE